MLWIMLGLDIDQMDVETTFLEGKLVEKERVDLKCPPGMDTKEDECLDVMKGSMVWYKLQGFSGKLFENF